jgi:hypothetical protein
LPHSSAKQSTNLFEIIPTKSQFPDPICMQKPHNIPLRKKSLSNRNKVIKETHKSLETFVEVVPGI